jgi:VCBS repeat-containing protein
VNQPKKTTPREILYRSPVALAVTVALAGVNPLAFGASPVPGSAAGADFNVTTPDTGEKSGPRAVMDAAGDFVVVWETYTNSPGIFARRYAADGEALGEQFTVDAPTGGSSSAVPQIAMDPAGDFVVTWEKYVGYDVHIYARCYAADGTPSGDAFQVSTNTSGLPSVGMDAAGDFVIAWNEVSGSPHLVKARRYTAGGTPTGDEFQVVAISESDNRQDFPKVAMDLAGDFVVTWEGQPAPGDGFYGIYAQRYAPDGSVQGSTFRVDDQSVDRTFSPSLAMAPEGNFVIAWDGDGTIHAQPFGSDGGPVGGNVLVTSTDHNNGVSDVAIDAAGDFTVTWTPDGLYYDIYARRFSSNGSAIAAAFQVNSLTSEFQGSPAVALDPAGDAVFTWENSYEDSTIFARRFVRNSSLDLSAGLILSPADSVVDPGSGLSLTVSVANTEAVSTLTGNSTVDAAVTTASGVTAMITLPPGVIFGSASGTGWSCPDPVAGILTCSYAPPLGAGATTPDITVDATIPEAPTAALDYSATVSGDQPDDDASNDTADASDTNSSDHAPVASSTPISTQAETAASGDLPASDSDGDTLTFQKVSSPSHGNAVVNPDGSYSYTPTTGYRGSDSFTFKANDGTFDSNIATLSITVLDNAPVAKSKTLAVNHNTATSGNAKSTDADSDSVTYAKVDLPRHGTLVLNKNTGAFTYRPATNYSGADRFTYTASDGTLASAPATVSVTVTEHTPVADKASFSMTHNTSHSGQLKSTDADAGDPRNFRKVTGPAHGTLTLNLNGSYVYKPKTNYKGADKFTFNVGDGSRNSNTATVSITVK